MGKGSAKSPDAAGKNRLGGFRIVRKIGQGGMGAVFQAVQESVDRPVALKVLPPRLARDKEYLGRFFREARAAARLNHPNVVQAIDAGEADGYYYFAMEYVEGPSVIELLQQGSMPRDQVLRIARDIGRALEAAHGAGIVHRDVKPANILLASDGTAKLADLGLARETTSRATGLTQEGLAIGTPDYISPEQVRGEADVDGRTDIYSLGATLYHMLTGQPPYTGGSGNEVMAKHLSEPVPDPHRVNPAIPLAAARVVRKAMAKDREHRYQTAAEMVQDIARALAQEEARERPQPAPPRSHAPERRRGPKLALAALVIIVLAAVAVAIVLRPREPAGPQSGGPTDLPAPRPVPREKRKTVKTDDAERLRELRAWVERNPERYATALRRCRDLLADLRDASVRGEAEQLHERVRAEGRQAADQAFEGIAREAAGLEKAGNYDAAIQRYGDLPDELEPLLEERSEAAVAALKTRAEARTAPVLQKAQELADSGEPKKGLDLLATLDGVRYGGVQKEVASLRERLRKQIEAAQPDPGVALARARKEFEALLGSVDAALAKDDVAGAVRLVKAARADEAMGPVDELVGALAESVDALPDVVAGQRRAAVERLSKLTGSFVGLRTAGGKVSGALRSVDEKTIVVLTTTADGQKKVEVPVASLGYETLARFGGGELPDTPVGAMAVAIRALAHRDAAAAGPALKAAEGHPLHAYYHRKFEMVRLGRVEVAAREAWEAIETGAEKEPIPVDEMRPLRERVERFEKEYGETTFAKSVADEVRELKRRLVPVFEKWPFDADEACRRQKVTAAVLGTPVTKTVKLADDVELKLALIPAGEFIMGSPRSERGRSKDEFQHRVRLTRPFYLAISEVTQAQWTAISGRNPSRFRGPRHPVDSVSWKDCRQFIRKLNQRTGGRFRLPTEAEWEYACRAGATTPFYFGRRVSTKNANYSGKGIYQTGTYEGKKRTVPVGQFAPNAFGLYDMAGNVIEWCADPYAAYPIGAVEDPLPAKATGTRVMRGGSWYANSSWLRSASRYHDEPGDREWFSGFRVVLDICNGGEPGPK
ncbi:MAG: protein kinase domain-containing protein [Planctomycetota bacterium]